MAPAVLADPVDLGDPVVLVVLVDRADPVVLVDEGRYHAKSDHQMLVWQNCSSHTIGSIWQHCSTVVQRPAVP